MEALLEGVIQLVCEVVFGTIGDAVCNLFHGDRNGARLQGRPPLFLDP